MLHDDKLWSHAAGLEVFDVLDEVLEACYRDTHLFRVSEEVVDFESRLVIVWSRSQLAYSELSLIARVSSLDYEGSLRVEQSHDRVRLVRSGFYRWE